MSAQATCLHSPQVQSFFSQWDFYFWIMWMTPMGTAAQLTAIILWVRGCVIMAVSSTCDCRLPLLCPVHLVSMQHSGLYLHPLAKRFGKLRLNQLWIRFHLEGCDGPSNRCHKYHLCLDSKVQQLTSIHKCIRDFTGSVMPSCLPVGISNKHFLELDFSVLGNEFSDLQTQACLAKDMLT